MSHDQRSHELAGEFLSDEAAATEHDQEELAEVIQNAIEGWLEQRRRRASSENGGKR